MFKTTIKLLLILIVVFAFTSFLSAQVLTTRDGIEKQKTVEKQEIPENQWRKFFDSANESAILNDGKLIFVKLPTANGSEKTFTLDHAKDGKSFVMIDEKGIRLQVFLNQDMSVSSVIMPDGEEAVFNWKKTADNLKAYPNIRFKGKDFIPSSSNPCSPFGEILTDNPRGGGGGGNPCRDAGVAIAIAAGVCAATGGGLSPACWAATANAAYHTYRCYEATQ